jgi:hypothetical protein
MKTLLAGLMILAAAALFPAGSYAQEAVASAQLGPTQARNTQTTETLIKSKQVGPNGQMIDKQEHISKNENIRGQYVYSGIPGKFMRK